MSKLGNLKKMKENTENSLEDSDTALEKRLNTEKNQKNIPKKTIAAIAAVTYYISLQETLIYPKPKLSPWMQKARQDFDRARTNLNYRAYPLLRYSY